MRDTELQRLVLEELDWDPKVDASEVGVTVEEGIVTLSGDVGSYAERYACLEAAKRVRGVKAVVEDLRVHVARAHARPDEELARRVLETLRWHVSVPDERIKPTVEDGWVVLEGDVTWHFQRSWAERAVRHLSGVRGVTNRIDVKPGLRARSADIQRRIEGAFTRSAELDARSVRVETSDGKVTLRGTVASWTEREAAEEAAWSAPGVTAVENELAVEAGPGVPEPATA